MRPDFLMKVLFVAIWGTIFTSCEQEDVPTGRMGVYVDVTKPFCEYNEKEQSIYFEARNRFGQFVNLQNGQYALTKDCDAEYLNLSVTVFDYFKSLMEQTNEDLKSLNVWENENGRLEIVIQNLESFRTLKTRAIEQGGVTKVEVNWYGYDLYISNRDLHNIALGATLATVLLTAAPELVGTKIAAVIAGLCALAAQELEYRFPDGVIIRVANVPATGCIPFDIYGQ